MSVPQKGVARTCLAHTQICNRVSRIGGIMNLRAIVFFATFVVLQLISGAPSQAGEAIPSDISGVEFLEKLLTAQPNNCRPDGYFCKSSIECCGFCRDGVCGMGGGGSCRPDGAACSSSIDCCGFCRDGVCGMGGGGSQCRPAGLACNSSIDCCNWCRDGVCD